MSNTVKSKFAGLLRGLLGRQHRGETAAEMEPRPVTAAAPDYPAALPAAAAPVGAEAAGENEITLPLAAVLAALPLDLRAKIVSVPPTGATIRIAVDLVLPQLAFGAVKISFGELRQLAAGVFSNSSSSELDGRPVSLPLHEILPRLNPALLARRNAERVEVDEEIQGPFAGRGRGVTFTTEPLKAAAAKPAPRSIEPAADIPPRAVTPAMPPVNPPTITPSAPIPFRPMTPAPSSRPPISPITSITGNGGHGQNGMNGAPPMKMANGLNGANGANGHHAPPPPIVPPTAKKPVAPAPPPVPPAAPRVEPAQPAIIVGLWDLAENWPDGLKEEISRSDIANANLPLPGAFVETGLRRGRITMTWKQIRLLAKPSSVPSPNDGLELELPLKLIAPLFFAAKKTLPTAKKAVNVSTDIPNLFFGFPQAAPEAPAPQRLAARPRPAAETAAPASASAAPVPTPALVSPANKAGSSTNFYVWGDDGETPQEETLFAPPPVPQTDFTSRRALPKDVVEKAVTFRGVAGALVTLPDGLRVASNVPVEFNADTLAAFIPQIFERMNQSARELRMGALNNVSFTVGNVPWRIFRVNSVYLAAFGRAGESLPAADLAALAGELDRKK